MRAAADPTLLGAEGRRWTLGAGALALSPLLLQLPGTTALATIVVGLIVAFVSRRRALPVVVRLMLAAALLGIALVSYGFSIGRDTACALLAVMLAIKPSELTTLRDARSLLGFSLFAPFATFLLDQGPVSLVLGLLAALVTLVALQVIARQDAHLAAAVPLRTRVRAVGRLVAIGLPLALTAFWLFPRLPTPLWGIPDRAMGRPGLSDSMSPGQWLDLMTDDEPALRATFAGAPPAPDQLYWRGPVMWDYDGRTWTQRQWMRGLPPPEVSAGTPAWDYMIELEPTDRRQLVALDLVATAPDGARLAFDHGLWSDRPLSSLTRWHLQSARPRTVEPELRPLLRDMALALPEGFNPRTVALARKWRAEAGTDDDAIVRRALAWIQRDFGYTLETPLPGRHAVDQFLFDQQAGFCEHFSSSFVVLMRAAGIPARVVTGYLGGNRNPMGGYLLVRRSDAHAWAEVWLPRRGWVRVDPTAAVAPERIYDTLADRASAGLDGRRSFGPTLDMGDWLRRNWNDLVLGFDASRQARMLRPFGFDHTDATTLVALFALVACGALGWMVWLTTRTEREPDAVLRAWRRLEKRYARLGLARGRHEPPKAWLARVAAARPDLADALGALVARFSDWRYAHAAGAISDAGALVSDLRAHRPTRHASPERPR